MFLIEGTEVLWFIPACRSTGYGRALPTTLADPCGRAPVVSDELLPIAYLAYEGEQHGFRRAENIKRTLDAELYFFSRVFDFALADPIEPVTIDNL
jgi:hypothetical protein